ncbi:hypothetical protein [Tenacibaculum dicentrarchi]|uniref:hypothetical protein n=1 Tax=Tenacibaculum dicentrarchi TaxID=669041 RepID=UPI003513C3BB
MKTLDYILDAINSPYLNYTVPKETIVKAVEPKINFDKLYENKKSKFLVEGFDKYTEFKTKKYLIDSALGHLSENKYINIHKIDSGEIIYQITHKGFLKIHTGFVQSFENDKIKLDNQKAQTNFENLMKVLAILIPALLSFFLGKLL